MTLVQHEAKSASCRGAGARAARVAAIVLAVFVAGVADGAGGDSVRVSVDEAAPVELVSTPDEMPQALPDAVLDPEPQGSEPVVPSTPASASKPAAAAPRPIPPTDRSDLPAWLAYKAKSQQFALPREARVFYRQGLAARDAGAVDRAVQLVRGAAELDPTYADPRFTLFTWLLPVSPGAALGEAATLVELARDSFVLQLTCAANAFYLAIQALFLGLVAVGLVLVLLHNGELRHRWQEWLSVHLSPFGARAWPWALLVLPYLLGAGLVLPTITLLALSWSMLRFRERAFLVLWAAALCSTPWVTGAMGRFAHPLEEDQGPFYGVLTLHDEPYAAARQRRFEGIAMRDPSNPYAQFGLAWTARQGGDLALAEGAYRRTLELWPDDDRVRNNLGNVLTLENRHDEAIESYRRAVSLNPANAAAYLNLSQQYTRHFDFRAAQEAISHAYALDFELLRRAQAQTTGEGLLPLVDQWLAPRAFWPALEAEGASSDGASALPPMWRGRVESSGGFAIVVLVCVLLGLVGGIAQERALPLRRCSNCDTVVCRRCAERRRATAYCKACAHAESGAQAFEFARMLLHRHREQVQRTGRIARTVLAMIIPGFGLLALRRVFGPLVILSLGAALLHLAHGDGMPFAYAPRFATPDRDLQLTLVIPWTALYVWSIGGYLIALATGGAARRVPVRRKRERERPMEDGARRAAA